LPGQMLSQRQDLFDFRKINYLETYKRNINFSYMQSLCLIGAYLAGANKEKIDNKIFVKTQQKIRKNFKGFDTKASDKGVLQLGKTKKFGSERFFAIVDFLIALVAEESTEQKNMSRSLDYMAAVNSLVEEGLLKRTANKKSEGGTATEDLPQICFKCNFDLNFIQEVSTKIDFKLDEYLYQGGTDNEN
jgi:hypothetical protein